MNNLLFIFFITTLLLGNDFLKIRIIGISQFPFWFIFLICLLYLINFLISKNKLNFNSDKIFTSFFQFLLYSFFIVIISSLSYIDLFQINNFPYNSDFLFRQSYFVFYFLIVGQTIYLINRKNTLFFDLFKKHYLVIFLLSFIFLRNLPFVNFLELSAAPLSNNLLFLVCSYYLYSVKKNRIAIILPLILLYQSNEIATNQGTTTGIIITVYYLVLFRKFLKLFLQRKMFPLFLLMTPFLIFLNTFNTANLDVNNLWRLNFWIHELSILKETYFFGVGFGTPYRTYEFYDNYGYRLSEKHNSMGHFRDAHLYIIGQHNSLVNLFYRLGFIGLILFIRFNFLFVVKIIQIKKLVSSDMQQSKDLEILFFFFVGSLSIILFNVGLESPGYFIPYLFVLSNSMGYFKLIEQQYISSKRFVYPQKNVYMLEQSNK